MKFPISPVHLAGLFRVTGISIFLAFGLINCGHPPSAPLLPERSAAVSSEKSRKVEEQLTATLSEARKLGPGNPLHLTTLYSLATYYREQKDYTEAEALYRELLSLKEEISGPNHLDVAFILEEFASLLRETDRTLEAELLTLRAESIRSGHAQP